VLYAVSSTLEGPSHLEEGGRSCRVVEETFVSWKRPSCKLCAQSRAAVASVQPRVAIWQSDAQTSKAQRAASKAPCRREATLVTAQVVMGFPYYGVREGRSTGVFEDWYDVQPLVNGCPGAKFKVNLSATGNGTTAGLKLQCLHVMGLDAYVLTRRLASNSC
jgi:Caulimovirus viroplasmin